MNNEQLIEANAKIQELVRQRNVAQADCTNLSVEIAKLKHAYVSLQEENKKLSEKVKEFEAVKEADKPDVINKNPTYGGIANMNDASEKPKKPRAKAKKTA